MPKQIIFVILSFVFYKYGTPYIIEFRKKVNAIYEAKFNFILFSKDNFKIPFWGSLALLVFILWSRDPWSIPFLIGGASAIVYKIIDTYRKTDLKYGTIAAFTYLFMSALYMYLGIMILILIGWFLVVTSRTTRHYDDD
ncbi:MULTISPECIES: hypothetical protein [unclassified Fusobacterium]|uniref:hypothetical protein n=1 Tax=unclassified Fusobacterium TaxID=2648384 RepID=UPI0025C17E7F|nr:hypothetical protein [Fusobacterium sp.]